MCNDALVDLLAIDFLDRMSSGRAQLNSFMGESTDTRTVDMSQARAAERPEARLLVRS